MKNGKWSDKVINSRGSPYIAMQRPMPWHRSREKPALGQDHPSHTRPRQQAPRRRRRPPQLLLRQLRQLTRTTTNSSTSTRSSSTRFALRSPTQCWAMTQSPRRRKRVKSGGPMTNSTMGKKINRLRLHTSTVSHEISLFFLDNVPPYHSNLIQNVK